MNKAMLTEAENLVKEHLTSVGIKKVEQSVGMATFTSIVAIALTIDRHREDWIPVSTPPPIGGEYNTIWELSDSGEPVVCSMDYDVLKNKWTDPRNNGANVTKHILFYKPLPEWKPKK